MIYTRWAPEVISWLRTPYSLCVGPTLKGAASWSSRISDHRGSWTISNPWLPLGFPLASPWYPLGIPLVCPWHPPVSPRVPFTGSSDGLSMSPESSPLFISIMAGAARRGRRPSPGEFHGLVFCLVNAGLMVVKCWVNGGLILGSWWANGWWRLVNGSWLMAGEFAWKMVGEWLVVGEFGGLP